jgi:hypothetical protein
MPLSLLLCDVAMDPLTQLYERLRTNAPPSGFPVQPPAFEDWMKYWDDEQNEFVNLRSFEHWLSRAAAARRTRS